MQWNDHSHFADLSFVYTDDPVSRTFKAGMLSTSQLENGETTFPRRGSPAECPLNLEQPAYHTPDVKAEQNSYLFSTQTVWLRNHNLIAKQLAHDCPHWNDERMFQVQLPLPDPFHSMFSPTLFIPCH
jgi:peroxidase